MMGWLIGGGVLCMLVLMTALCVVSGDADRAGGSRISALS